MINKYVIGFVITIAVIISTVQVSLAYSTEQGYRPVSQGWIVENVSLPVDTAKAVNNEDEINPDMETPKLRVGESRRRNFLKLVDVGNAGIDEAAKKAGITKIKYVDIQVQKVYVPLGFIPIFVKETVTKVYGE